MQHSRRLHGPGQVHSTDVRASAGRVLEESGADLGEVEAVYRRAVDLQVTLPPQAPLNPCCPSAFCRSLWPLRWFVCCFLARVCFAILMRGICVRTLEVCSQMRPTACRVLRAFSLRGQKVGR